MLDAYADALRSLWPLLVLGVACAALTVGTGRGWREAQQRERERLERAAAHDAAWCAEHPELAALGIPAPPTADHMTEIYYGERRVTGTVPAPPPPPVHA